MKKNGTSSKKPRSHILRRNRAYLSARYSRYKEMQLIASDMRQVGWEIISSWIGGNHHVLEQAKDAEDFERRMRLVAEEDLRDLARADALVFIGETPGPYEGGGRFFELGWAFARNMDVYVIGPRQIIFEWLPQVKHYESLSDFLAKVRV